jgi:hypothetical protein
MIYTNDIQLHIGVILFIAMIFSILNPTEGGKKDSIQRSRF